MRRLALWIRTIDSMRSCAIAHGMVSSTELPKDLDGLITVGSDRNFAMRSFEQLIGQAILIAVGQISFETAAWTEEDLP